MSRPLPLDGVTVVDLGQIYNGPYCSFMLAMAGARVIKIEAKGGEHLRRRSVVGGAALPFAMLNSNKSFATLNLKSERGRELLMAMVQRADVVVENFAPGAMDRLGLGYAALSQVNPRLVYGAGSGYGRSGPNRNYPAMDLTVQAMAGIMSVTGFPDRPLKAGPALCDFFGGTHLYAGIMTALFERERTGQGRLVEVAMQEAVYASLASNLGLHYGSGGQAPERTGNRHGGLAESPYNVYPTRDGHIAIICVGESHWKSLLKAMGREELLNDPRYADLKSRVDYAMDDIDALVSGYTAQHGKQALFDLLMSHRVPCAPVRKLDEVVNDAHMHERGALEWVDHPMYGRVCLMRSPLRFEGSDPLPIKPSGELGRDNREVYGQWLGLSDSQLQQLVDEEVI